MVFVKVVKNKAYYKRYQTKFRRRREGKTDYQQRKNMTVQDNNKYGVKKYRFVVRITGTKILCQVIYAELKGDIVLCQASSQELRRFGQTAGLTSYPAAYSTGLLLARRLLKSLGMDTMYKGNEHVGRKYDVSRHQGEQRPFKAVLDVGLARTTTGARVFGALKGACDGGLHIPHHTRRFPGSNKSKKRCLVKYKADAHRERIMGSHVQTWTDGVWEEKGEETYEKMFKNWSKCLDDNKTENMEDIHKAVHEAIRANPVKVVVVKERVKPEPSRVDKWGKRFFTGAGKEYRRDRRLTNAERKQRVQLKLDIYAQQQAEKEEEDEEEEEEDEDEEEGSDE